MSVDPVVVLITSSGREEAERIGRALVEERLAACVNILGGIRSIFRWEGRVTEEEEALMVIKSRSDMLDELTERAKALHSYSLPEIIALPIIGGSREYLSWIEETCARKAD